MSPEWATDGREMRQGPREVADSTILARDKGAGTRLAG